MTDTFGHMLNAVDPLDAILATARLSTDNSRSSYGYPVLEIGSDVYGATDIVPGTSQSQYPGAGMTAAAVVAKQAVMRAHMSDDDLALAARFCALNPAGPQIYRDEAGEVRAR